MPQTTVGYRQNKWLTEGQVGDTSIRRLDGAIVNTPNGETGVLPFGRVTHLVNGKAVLPTQAADATHLILGVNIFNERWGLYLRDLLKQQSGLQASGTIPENAVGYPALTNVLVETMTMGDIVMYSEEALNPGDLIAYRFATASLSGSQLGQIRKGFTGTAAGAQVGCELLPGARAYEACSAGSLVLVRLGTVTPTTGFSVM
ncbi:MAG: hypothetical protein KME27_10625 [Lyngbya sp. HA4199-MV5]|jgi:hypothetical protein|nr:hypothetical protein [Lyngbya sp. HA4199-MV5]